MIGICRTATLLVGTALLCGCGHPATEADCELIAVRIAELELRAQSITDPAEIQRKKNETLGLGGVGNSRKELLEGCVGRRITEKALACVRQAKTSEEITSQCLR